MPLYSDSNYYYSGGSSQLFSPYYPVSSSLATSTSSYNPYSSTYNRTISGSYVVPITPSRSPSYSTHGLTSSSRYQPKLTTITESSPLMSVGRHSTLMPLTRINSPKYTSSYSSSSTPIHLPKYTPPKPILINTADIDVSANRYRKRKEEALRQAHLEHEAEMASMTSAARRETPSEDKNTTQKSEVRNDPDIGGNSEEPHRNRSTIKRNRAVVRLSTIRARSKDRNRTKVEDKTSPEPNEKKFKDQFGVTEPISNPEDSVNRRQSLTDTPNVEDATDELLQEPLKEVILELDPKDHTVRRLSIPQCPTFHDICEDISSDKIDDDLNAGALRRRASIIQIQEQQLLNQLQKSPSGSFQMIHLERRGSHDSSDGGVPHKRHSKRQSKKGNKIRHKITAIVEVENAPASATNDEKREEESLDREKSPRPKFTVNVESVEEHHELHKVFKLPKKKSVKKATKVKEQQLPDGFMTPLPKPQTSPKKKMVEKKETFKTTAEIFTFDDKAVQEAKKEEEIKLQIEQNEKSTPVEIWKKSLSEEDSTPKNSPKEQPKALTKVSKVFSKAEEEPKTPTKVNKIINKEEEKPASPKILKTAQSIDLPKPVKAVEEKLTSKTDEKPSTPNALKSTQSLDAELKQDPLEKSNSITVELKTAKTATAKTPLKEETKTKAEETLTTAVLTKPEEKKTPPKTLKSSLSLDSGVKPTPVKTFEKSNSITVELKTPTTPTTPTTKAPLKASVSELEKVSENKKAEAKILKTSQSLDNAPKPTLAKTLEKSNSINVELKTPTTPTSKPQTPSTESIPEEPPVATPKPIRKAIKKSDSGEDFWSQIGTRETMYMNKRKQELVESLWKKREDLLESTTRDVVENLDEIKSTVSEQKEEALKQAEEAEQKSRGTVGRSSSNESALKEKETVSKVKDEENLQKKVSPKATALKKEPVTKVKEEEKVEKKVSPIKKITTTQKSVETPKTPDFTTPGVKDTKNDSPLKKKLISTKTDESGSEKKLQDDLVDSKEAIVNDKTKISAIVTEANAKISTNTTARTTTTTPTKITGQQAKSPEQQEQEEQTTKQTTQAKGNNNTKQNELDINKTLGTAPATASTTATKTNDQPTLLAKALTSAKDNNVKITAKSSAEASTTKQPETKTTTEETKPNAVTTTTTSAVTNKPKSTDAEPKLTKKLQSDDKKTPTKAKAQTPPKAKATKLSPQSVINADQFIAKAPAKSNASPVKQTKTTTTTAAATTSPIKTIAAQQSAPTKKTPEAATKKKTTNATSTNDAASAVTIATSSITTAITPTVAATATSTTTTKAEEIRNINKNSSTEHDDEDVINSNGTRGGNLSKFATVSNLAQCLQDVDADLDDYIASSAEISEDENYIDDSDFDYSSIDGWDKFTPSMKKKIKQRRRKEKQAEEARFDPQKKVKIAIDTTRKLFVKEEAPRYPLVATPRPLWKREKIVYPVDDSDESDSEESGSTEDTDESDESTTSEEYEDDLNPNTASGGGAASGSGSGGSSSDPNIIRMSTCSNDSGFEGGTAPSSPKKMLETSYTYSQFQKSGRFTPPATIIPRFKNYTVDDFHFLAVLGKGSFGKVLLAELRDTTYYYAVKCLKKDVVLEDDDVDSTLIERKVLALGTKHPYLCHLFCTFQTESHLFFVMEYLNGGDLMFHIQESGRFTEERARFYGAEIISGLKFLHKKGIIYRDLKLDNVLLDYEGHVRIADFGMCKLQIYLDKTADSFCGTPDYMAPEIIKGESYNQNVDWWSFGVLLYEMLIGQSPFSGCDEDELFWSICNEIPWFPVYISAEATSILKGLLDKNHERRIGSQYSPAGDVVEHIFFRPIDWNLLEKRQIEPPFRPQVKHPLDTQYFDRVFTRERVRLTPIDKDILQSMDQKQFLGFTYTNPHITLD